MSRDFKEFLSHVKGRISLYQAFEEGFTPEDIKSGVVEILSSYFKNQEILGKTAVNYLMPDVIDYSRISNLEIPLNAFKYAHEVHYQALKNDEELSLKTCAQWITRVNDGLSIFWSQFLLEIDKSDLEISEFLYEILRNIGSLLEGAMQPLLQELLQQTRIVRNKDASIEKILKLKYGNVVDELYQVSGNENIFVPNGIRINQWRNVAYHHSARVENDKIVCILNESEEVIFTKEDLLKSAKLLFNIFSGFRLAYNLFSIDNIEKMKSMDLLPEIKLRDEQYLLNIVSAMASQGFEVIDFIEDETNLKMIIQDVSNENPNDRRIHTIQFILFLWAHSKKTKSIAVEYWEKDGTPNLRTTASLDLLNRYELEGLPTQEVIKIVDLYDLKNSINIP